MDPVHEAVRDIISKSEPGGGRLMSAGVAVELMLSEPYNLPAAVAKRLYSQIRKGAPLHLEWRAAFATNAFRQRQGRATLGNDAPPKPAQVSDGDSSEASRPPSRMSEMKLRARRATFKSSDCSDSSDHEYTDGDVSPRRARGRKVVAAPVLASPPAAPLPPPPVVISSAEAAQFIEVDILRSFNDGDDILGMSGAGMISESIIAGTLGEPCDFSDDVDASNGAEVFYAAATGSEGGGGTALSSVASHGGPSEVLTARFGEFESILPPAQYGGLKRAAEEHDLRAHGKEPNGGTDVYTPMFTGGPGIPFAFLRPPTPISSHPAPAYINSSNL